MPIYEYICEDCGEKFDIMRTMSAADSPAQCKKCDGMHTRRLISVFFAKSDGRSIAGSGGSCNGCGGGSCSSCSHS